MREGLSYTHLLRGPAFKFTNQMIHFSFPEEEGQRDSEKAKKDTLTKGPQQAGGEAQMFSATGRIHSHMPNDVCQSLET